MTDNRNAATILLTAARFAAERHRDQRRKGDDAAPYINHPIGVAAALAEHGIDDTELLVAALLHDTVEDTETCLEEIDALFGARVAAIVEEVSDDKSLPKAERKRLQVEHAPHKTNDAKMLKIADKTNNLRDILNSPPDWPDERKKAYFDWAKSVIDQMRGAHPGLEAAFDEAYASLPRSTD